MTNLRVASSLFFASALCATSLAHATGEDFVSQLRSYCNDKDHSQASYSITPAAQGQATLTWKCPFRVALRVAGASGMEFIFNGSEAWFFYPSRPLDLTKPALLEKTEHYKSLENRLLKLWLALWQKPASVSDLYDLSMKVEDGVQVFAFTPTKPKFPALKMGFALSERVKIPALLTFVRPDSVTYTATLVKGTAKSIKDPGDRFFNPIVPSAKINQVILEK